MIAWGSPEVRISINLKELLYETFFSIFLVKSETSRKHNILKQTICNVPENFYWFSYSLYLNLLILANRNKFYRPK